jgi:plasmid stability protein
LPNAATARQEALAAAREILTNATKSGGENFPEAFVIADSEGCELDTVPLAAALPKRLMNRLS